MFFSASWSIVAGVGLAGGIVLHPVLERTRGAPADLRSNIIGRRQLRPDPAPAFHIEHSRQAAQTIPRVLTDVWLKGDGDLGCFVGLKGLFHSVLGLANLTDCGCGILVNSFQLGIEE